jgi:hypothetical protein
MLHLEREDVLLVFLLGVAAAVPDSRPSVMILIMDVGKEVQVERRVWEMDMIEGRGAGV